MYTVFAVFTALRVLFRATPTFNIVYARTPCWIFDVVALRSLMYAVYRDSNKHGLLDLLLNCKTLRDFLSEAHSFAKNFFFIYSSLACCNSSRSIFCKVTILSIFILFTACYISSIIWWSCVLLCAFSWVWKLWIIVFVSHSWNVSLCFM